MAISISRKRIFNSCPPEIDLAPALLLTLAASWLVKDGGVLLAKFSLMGLFRIAGALTRGRALNRITVSKSQLSNVSFTLEILNVTSTEVT